MALKVGDQVEVYGFYIFNGGFSHRAGYGKAKSMNCNKPFVGIVTKFDDDGWPFVEDKYESEALAHPFQCRLIKPKTKRAKR